MVLNNISWGFSNETYPDYESFNERVVELTEELDEDWDPDEIVVNKPMAEIQYMAWLKIPAILLENEELIEPLQMEVVSVLTADNGKYFTALEFLYKMHHQQANKYLGSHYFFEGVDLMRTTNGVPTYFIHCGS